MASVLDTLNARATHDDVTVDLREVFFLRPVHMVGAMAHAEMCARRRVGFALLAPARRDPRVYAARMRLGSGVSSLGGRHDLPTDVHEHDQTAHLLEISPIDSHDDVRSLAALVQNKVRPVDQVLANALWESINEVGHNVRDHAEVTGFMAAQTMPSLGELRFAVADAGPGFLTTLRRRAPADDAAAIGLALDGVSRHDGAERGNGLRDIVRLVTELGGSVYLASGHAEVEETASSRTAWVRAGMFKGTLFEATIPLSTGRHARSIQ